MSGLLVAALELDKDGTFSYIDRVVTTPELKNFLGG